MVSTGNGEGWCADAARAAAADAASLEAADAARAGVRLCGREFHQSGVEADMKKMTQLVTQRYVTEAA